MTIINSRESMLSHESKEYIESRPKWTMGRIPDLSDYRKLSVDNFEEALKLARLGQEMASMVIPKYHGKPLTLTFTQSLIIGAATIDRPHAAALGLDFEKYRSVLMVTPSRYGKSFLNAVALIIMAGAGGKECQIGGATKDKAAIIQNKIVQLLPDTIPAIQDGLVVTSDDEEAVNKKIARMSTQVSKEALMWRNGGSIKSFSTNEGNKSSDVQAAGAIGIGGDYCVDGDSEVLTHLGWVKLKDLDDGVEVAQYTEDGKIEFVMPSRVVRRHYKGEGYTFSPSKSDDKVFMVPEHRQPFMSPSGEIVVKKAKDWKVYNYWAAIVSGDGTGPNTLSAMDRIVIACQADGCILKTTDKGNYFQFRVKKERKARRLEMLFEEAEMDVKIHQDKRGYYVCHFYMPHNCDKILHHWFGWSCGKDKARAILEELVEWDGYRYPSNILYYSSTVKENTDWVSAIALQGGYRGNMTIQEDNRKSTFNTVYRIHLYDEYTHVCDYSNWNKADWDGMVYCVTVPSGLFPIRHGKSTIITGNCVFDELQLLSPVGFRTASRFMMEGPDTKRFCVGNPQINGHFKDLYDDPSTFVIHANDITAIVEERMTRHGFELTGIPTYSNEYRYFIQTEFPDETSGTRFFSTMPLVWDKAKLGEPVSKYYFMGIDSAYKGADGIVVSILSLNMDTEGHRWCVVEEQFDAKKRFSEWSESTTLDICLDILKIWDKYECRAGCIDIGYGIHIYEKMKQLYPEIALEPINFAAKPTEWRVENEYNAKYAVNKRAEMHLDVKDLCENHLLYICPDTYDEAVREMREVGNSPEASKVKIEAKKNIKMRIGRSPDFLDSACLAVHAMILSGQLNGEVADDSMLVEFIN